MSVEKAVTLLKQALVELEPASTGPSAPPSLPHRVSWGRSRTDGMHWCTSDGWYPCNELTHWKPFDPPQPAVDPPVPSE